MLRRLQGYNPIFFSYPFGEYSLIQKNYIKKKFKYAFGQHSGIIDLTKDKFELPRFPINEKYGDLRRFKFLVDLLPFQYKNLTPEEKFVKIENNPPKMIVDFFDNQKNLSNLNCFSNEGNVWKETEMKFYEKKLIIKFIEKFQTLRVHLYNYSNYSYYSNFVFVCLYDYSYYSNYSWLIDSNS